MMSDEMIAFILLAAMICTGLASAGHVMASGNDGGGWILVVTFLILCSVRITAP